MKWPQIVVLVGLTSTTLVTAVVKTRDRKLSSTMATAHILGHSFGCVLHAWILHCGGFW